MNVSTMPHSFRSLRKPASAIFRLIPIPIKSPANCRRFISINSHCPQYSHVPELILTPTPKSAATNSSVARLIAILAIANRFGQSRAGTSAAEMKIDSFEADRAPARIGATGEPVHGYRTMNLGGIFVRENGLFMKPENKGKFYHDGRFQILLDTVKSYDARFNLGLSDQEEHDLVEYLKSL